MTVISLIAALDSEQGLGQAGQLLCYLPADLQHFKALTLGKPIVMGRKTHASIGRLLPNRLNIILSRTALVIEGAVVVSSLQQAFSAAQPAPEVMIIGGASIYAQALPYAQRLYLTRIQHRFPADVFFPAINWSEWRLVTTQQHPINANNRYAWSFDYYERMGKV